MPGPRNRPERPKRRMPTWRYQPDLIGRFVGTYADGSLAIVTVRKLVPTCYAGGYRGPGDDKYEIMRGVRDVAPMTPEDYKRGLEGWAEAVRKVWPDIGDVGTFDWSWR